MGNSPHVDSIGSHDYDYGRWLVTSTGFDLNGLHGELFKPHSHWKSYGTYAVMDIREYGYFTRSGITASSYVNVRVHHDY